MSQSDFVYQVLWPFVKRFRYAKDAAAALKISKGYLTRLLQGARVSKTVARRLGYEVRREPVFVKVEL